MHCRLLNGLSEEVHIFLNNGLMFCGGSLEGILGPDFPLKHNGSSALLLADSRLNHSTFVGVSSNLDFVVYFFFFAGGF